MIEILFRLARRALLSCKNILDTVVTYMTMTCLRVVHSDFRTQGKPTFIISRGGMMRIGSDFSMNNNITGNPIGCYGKCTFFVAPGAKIEIGNHVGLSQTALVAVDNIHIGDYVKIGGGTQIFTTDFHSLSSTSRKDSQKDKSEAKKSPVIIEDNVFIGAGCIILKGVTIGENSIIGAGSVVTCSIPSNQIWAGNPAHYIRNTED